MRGRTMAGALLVFLFSAPHCSEAQTRRPGAAVDTGSRIFSIRGNVRNGATEAGLEMIKVELRRFTGEIVSATFSRQNGEFEFNGVANGNYLLVIDEKGFEPVRENTEVMGSSRMGILLYLRKPVMGSSAETGTAVSVRELALPRRTRDTFRKGMAQLYDKRDSRASIAQFQKTVAEAPGYYEAYFHLGIAQLENEQVTEAESSFRRCIELLGSDVFTEPYFALASLLSNQNRFAEAEPLTSRGLAMDISPWQGHYERARALMGLQRTDEAEKSALEAMQRRSDFAPVYLLLANIHIRRKEYPALMRDLNEYLRLEPAGSKSAQAREMLEQVRKTISDARASSAPARP